ncbi:carbon-nitrogen hydrolase family protein [Heyndrickxia acidiproducens]|uniref:carbon-nitrogen hydrolase family protein n=1 Tax=Heyndrickxia acidiproducens TaxID=1121084 RepID=UPI000369899D|nr:carbon-nitrogen hydrolase family protein [Heyndrickxia acidiproducens]
MVHIAIAQFTPHLGDKSYNLQKMDAMMALAEKHQAELILFPELSLTGYSISKELDTFAEPATGKSIRFMQNACKNHRIHALFSFPEARAGAFHIAAALIDDKGKIIGIYRKSHLFDKETEAFQPGDVLSIFETKLGKLGCMICYDLEFPEAARELRLKGADLILVPLANMSPYENNQSIYAQSRAMENQVPVVLCNRTGDENGMHFFGESVAVDGNGSVIKKLGNGERLEIVHVPLFEQKDKKVNYLKDRRVELYPTLLSEAILRE